MEVDVSPESAVRTISATHRAISAQTTNVFAATTEAAQEVSRFAVVILPSAGTLAKIQAIAVNAAVCALLLPHIAAVGVAWTGTRICSTVGCAVCVAPKVSCANPVSAFAALVPTGANSLRLVSIANASHVPRLYVGMFA